jgi:hypothetical protein
VVNGSFGDRFIEGIYLHADQTTPGIWMYDFKSKSRYMVKDWKPILMNFLCVILHVCYDQRLQAQQTLLPCMLKTHEMTV